MVTKAGDIRGKVEAREKQLSDLHKRMDADLDLWNLKQATYDKHKTAINITTNHPRTFADDIYAPLSRAEIQIIIRMAEAEGEDKREDIGKLERLFHFLLELADLRLRRMLLPPARDWIIWFFNIRGWASARVLIEKPTKEDTIISNFTPCDPRWMTWEVGKDDLLWGAYKTFRSRADLKASYGYEPSQGFHFPWGQAKDSLPVIDHWEGEPGKMVNTVVCGDATLLGPAPHNLPHNPFIIRQVATRPPIASTSGFDIEGFGDSLYAPNRAIYDLENRLYSIEATRANLMSKQPIINYYGLSGKLLDDTVMQAEAVLNLPEGENKLEPVPMKEIPMTLLDLSRAIGGMRERAELPRIDIGKPPPSGTLFNLVEQSGDKIFVPQLRALMDFYADVLYMMEEQLLMGKYKVKVKAEVDRKYYEAKVTPVDLKEPHIIKVEFTAKTLWRDMDALTVADMQKRLGLPDEFIWEKTLKLQDPKRLKKMAAVEVAEHSPKFALKEAFEALMEEGREEEANMVRGDIDRIAEMEGLTGTPEGEPPPEMAPRMGR